MQKVTWLLNQKPIIKLENTHKLKQRLKREPVVTLRAEMSSKNRYTAQIIKFTLHIIK